MDLVSDQTTLLADTGRNAASEWPLAVRKNYTEFADRLFQRRLALWLRIGGVAEAVYYWDQTITQEWCNALDGKWKKDTSAND